MSDVSDEKITILTDVPVKSPKQDALRFGLYSNRLADIIMNSEPRFAVGIFGTWGTGKTSLMKLIEANLNESYGGFVLCVWFEAWRYDRDKYLAIIPFLRQIKIKLENVSASDNKWKFIQREDRWNVIKKGIEKTLRALSESSEVGIGYGSVASANLNFKNLMDSLESDGSTRIDGEMIHFYEHPTDHLKSAIRKARNTEKNGDRIRIVLFIDDLDRCTPEKALEVLESIKAFLDIEGIVYVIAMDSNSIDAIIKKKFGEGSTVKGIDYLQKIVQLPFQVPTWREGWEVQAIEKSIKQIISSELAGYSRVDELKDNVNFIVKAVQLNPREVKRFINNVILAESVFSTHKDKLTIINLICVQALSFRHDWKDFLDRITNDDIRKNFFTHYMQFKELLQKGKISVPTVEEFESKGSESNTRLNDIITDIYGKMEQTRVIDKSYIQNKVDEILPVYVDYIKQGPILKKFLDAGADKIFLEIDKMGKYRMALEITKHQKDILSRADMELDFSCWRYDKADKDFPGKRMYAFHVIVKASDSILDRIDFVTYTLSSSYPNPVRTIGKDKGRKGHFGLKELAWGPSTIYADVLLDGQKEMVSLSHPVILREKDRRLLPAEELSDFVMFDRFPAEYQTGVELSPPIKAWFNKALDKSTINPINFNLKSADGSNVPGILTISDVSFDLSTVTFSPSENLLPGANYVVTVTDDVKSIDGTRLNRGSSWSFMTGKN